MSTHLAFTRGDAWPFTVDSITDLSGAAVSDVSAWGCRFTVRKSANAGGGVVATASTSDATISRGAGLFSWTIPKTTTAAIAPDVYVFDVELSDANGNPQTQHGTITVSADQTI